MRMSTAGVILSSGYFDVYRRASVRARGRPAGAAPRSSLDPAEVVRHGKHLRGNAVSGESEGFEVDFKERTTGRHLQVIVANHGFQAAHFPNDRLPSGPPFSAAASSAAMASRMRVDSAAERRGGGAASSRWTHHTGHDIARSRNCRLLIASSAIRFRSMTSLISAGSGARRQIRG